VVQADAGESGQVGSGGQKAEVGGDALQSASAGAAAAHEVDDFAFDFVTGGA
jgi:hypothetical protein